VPPPLNLVVRGLMPLIIATLTFILSCSVYAWDTPETALSKYLKYDFDGNRLGGGDWEDYITNYVDVEKDHEEPGYDMATIIISYSFSTPICRPTTCITTVTYNLAKTQDHSEPPVFPHPNGGTERRIFTITKRANEWRIYSGWGNPYISEEANKK
jgi:hypothetical protein